MTRPEFTGQFTRLCSGFRHEPTLEQTEAWWRKVGHVGLSVWAETVTTLLCAKYFPKLDETLDTIETEAERQRKALVECDKPKAYVLHKQIVNGGGGDGLSRHLMSAILAIGGREQIRRYQQVAVARIAEAERFDIQAMKANAERALAYYQDAEKATTAQLAKVVPKLTEEELSEFMARYGEQVNT